MRTTRKFNHLSTVTAVLLLTGGLAAGALAQEKAATGDRNQFADDAGGSEGGGVQLVTGSTYDLILASLEKSGFTGELTTDSEGDPLIKSTDKDEPFSVHFYGCTEGKDCEFVQFTSGWNMDNGITLAKIEEWNSNKVWGQAYRDDDKDPWLGLAVNLKGGVTVENFDDTVDWWRVILDQFEEHIGWSTE